ncbi:hypothetical protein HZ994_06895 [Akkermansiaceae bacterium]|nr:hypothetical protein HZ994_06895 [Akkermansiaceae bacterium]
MQSRIHSLAALLLMASLATLCPAQSDRQSQPFKLHNIFGSGMVLQRDKPIKVWGWAKPGAKVTVALGKESAEPTTAAAAPVEVFGYEEAYKGLGKWEVSFPPREASTEPITLTATHGGETITLDNILLGDVWVMHGQSNMAFPAAKTDAADLLPQADLPLLRLFSITTNEQATLQDDIRPEAIDTVSGSWDVSSPETAREFAAIGYVFGLNVQRTLGIPIGLIKTARGGASIESMVPAHKFDEHPLTKRYADHVRARMAAFDPEAEADRIWGIEKGRAKKNNKPEPERPDPKNLRSWNVPGKSPSDMASVHNGFLGVFKGLNIKGLAFHQGFNNTLGDNARPKRYRVLLKLMVEGIREDFNDPQLPVAVIGFCADGSAAQGPENFEVQSIAIAPFIRESQRLGLADVGDPENTIFIPGYDVQAPGLHPGRKRDHGWRAAKWALSKVYGVQGARWLEPIKLVSAEAHGDVMVLGFDMRVQTKDGSKIPRGFSIAGEDGIFYMAHARYAEYGKGTYWTHGHRSIQVWSPMVEKPVAVRYGWGVAPVGNLYVAGEQDQPFPSFRTDDWDYPESEIPDEKPDFDWKKASADATARVRERQLKESAMGEAFLERLDQLSVPIVPLEKAAQKGK